MARNISLVSMNGFTGGEVITGTITGKTISSLIYLTCIVALTTDMLYSFNPSPAAVGVIIRVLLAAVAQIRGCFNRWQSVKC